MEKSLYKITGVLRNGKRFPAIYTNSGLYAAGINLYRGTKYKLNDKTGKYEVKVRVYN